MTDSLSSDEALARERYLRQRAARRFAASRAFEYGYDEAAFERLEEEVQEGLVERERTLC